MNSMLPRILPQPANPSLGDEGRPHARLPAGILKAAYVLYSLGAGIALLYLPWTNIWENNYILYLYPQIRLLVANPFFKGAVLGLGIANILMGIHEVVHFKNTPKGFFSG